MSRKRRARERHVYVAKLSEQAKRYDEIGFEIVGENVQCTNSVGPSTRKKRGKRDKKNVKWTDVADRYLTDILVEQTNLGRKDDNGFTSEGWKEIERLMKDKLGDAYDKNKIRNRLRTLKSHYAHIKTLLGLSGFEWDDVAKRVTASDQVWDDYIKAHPDYELYQNRSLVDFQKFSIIYGNLVADERDLLLTYQRSPHPMDALQTPNDDVVEESSSSEKRDEGAFKASRTRSDSSTSTPRNVPRETTTDEDLARAIKELATTMARAIEKMIQTGPSQSDVVAAVQELNLERSVRGRALRLLRDQQASSQFLAFSSVEDRREWLLEELDNST